MARKNDKRDLLVATAAGLFWRRGYALTSLADLARESGVPLGNIYYYFKTKAELARMVANIFVEETERMLAEISDASSDARGRLQLLVDRLAHTLKSRVEHGCPIAFAIRDFHDEAPEAAMRAGESFSLLIAFIARELGRTGLRPSLALGVARNAVVEWQGGITLAHALKEPAILAECFRRMEKILVNRVDRG
ncbi:MAG: TetR/AcrR family transcriptional regulator [Phyllobacterium sp.]